jgi:hypothetical protein
MDIRCFFTQTQTKTKMTEIKTKTPKEEEEEEEFECPRCHCILRGEDANDRRMWISTDPNGEDPNDGYDVCDECEEAAMAEERPKKDLRPTTKEAMWKIVVETQPKAANGSDCMKATLYRWRPDGYEYVDHDGVTGALYDTKGRLDVAFNFGLGAHDDLRAAYPTWDELEVQLDPWSAQFYALLDEGEEEREDIQDFLLVRQ